MRAIRFSIPRGRDNTSPDGAEGHPIARRGLAAAPLAACVVLMLLGCAHPTWSTIAATAGDDFVPAADAESSRAPSGAPDYAALTPGLSRFGYDLLRIRAEAMADENILVSPTSLGTAFALLGEGAGGDTRSAIAEALGMPSGTTMAQVGGLREALSNLPVDVSFGMANGVWVAKDLPLRDAYPAAARKDFGAEVAAVDFNLPSTRPDINTWFSSATRGLIKEMFTDLPAQTRIVLGNALYFKAAWASPFDPGLTRAGAFQSPAGPVQVPMMSQSFTRMGYMDGGEWHAVRVPFAHGHHEMVLVLPKQGTDAAGLIPCKDCASGPPKWTRPSGWATTRIDLTMPRFQLSAGGDMIDLLRGTVMAPALKRGADYGALAEEPIEIAMVVHRVTFSVDERGAEAAAATGIAGTRSMQGPPVAFTVDRPFLALIRHVPTDAVLVAGLVRNPTGG